MLRRIMVYVAAAAATLGSLVLAIPSPALAASAPSDTSVAFTAKLIESGTFSRGVATYSETTAPEGVHQVLKVEVSNQAPNASMKIIVSGVVVGSLTTDSRGAGGVKIAGDLPASAAAPSLPRVHAGSVITVGLIKGTFR
jgi:hypothetical protein